METSLMVYDYPEPDWVNEEDEEEEKKQFCSICFEDIEDEDDIADDYETYDGPCHIECYEQAQESRLK